jgi:hypothetical protein
MVAAHVLSTQEDGNIIINVFRFWNEGRSGKTNCSSDSALEINYTKWNIK